MTTGSVSRPRTVETGESCARLMFTSKINVGTLTPNIDAVKMRIRRRFRAAGARQPIAMAALFR